MLLIELFSREDSISFLNSSYESNQNSVIVSHPNVQFYSPALYNTVGVFFFVYTFKHQVFYDDLLFLSTIQMHGDVFLELLFICTSCHFDKRGILTKFAT